MPKTVREELDSTNLARKRVKADEPVAEGDKKEDTPVVSDDDSEPAFNLDKALELGKCGEIITDPVSQVKYKIVSTGDGDKKLYPVDCATDLESIKCFLTMIQTEIAGINEKRLKGMQRALFDINQSIAVHASDIARMDNMLKFCYWACKTLGEQGLIPKKEEKGPRVITGTQHTTAISEFGKKYGLN